MFAIQENGDEEGLAEEMVVTAGETRRNSGQKSNM